MLHCCTLLLCLSSWLCMAAGAEEQAYSRAKAKIAKRSAKIYLLQNNAPKATEQLLIAVAGDPQDEESHFLLGGLLAARGDYEGMDAEFLKALSLKPSAHRSQILTTRQNASVSHYNQGIIALKTDDHQKAYSEFSIVANLKPLPGVLAGDLPSDESSMASRIDSLRTEACKILGVVCAKTNRLEEAKAFYRTAASLDTTDATPLLNLGNLALDAGELDLAIGVLDTARARDPMNAAVLTSLAAAYRRLGDPAAAIRVYGQALAASPDNADILLAMGVLHFRDKQYSLAAETFRRVLSLDPGYSDARFNLAQACVELENWDEATRLLKEVISSSPTDAASLFQLGSIYARREMNEEAIETFLEAAAADPGNINVWYQLSSLYAKAGLARESGEALEKAQAIGRERTR